MQCGWVIGDYFTDQVLLVKTAWGGKSLYKDFRPPSSGGQVGPYYTKMIAEVREALANLKTDFPSYDGAGYELAGFVWYQGWNDGCEPTTAVPQCEKPGQEEESWPRNSPGEALPKRVLPRRSVWLPARQDSRPELPPRRIAPRRIGLQHNEKKEKRL